MSGTPPIAALAGKLAGKFVVLDGPDGAGKSTQLDLLADGLASAGLSVCRLRDPGGTEIGDRIRDILLDRAHDGMSVECELLLYMASRAQLAHQRIRPALAAGQCVLCDRFISSTIAYQGAGGVDVETIHQLGCAAVGDTWPDVTVILDIDSAAGLARIAMAPDRMESKGPDFHRKVREAFCRQGERQPDKVVVIDAAGTVDQTHDNIIRALADWANAQAGS
ncbi:hypothetical protein LCGC14_0238890 [marine sediment metagenome]|uniref:dTMP kinase n=1 Tax=marine sediment metagenome TaxID=412755 RepID=A0A0F9UPH1_9ZZZZ